MCLLAHLRGHIRLCAVHLDAERLDVLELDAQEVESTADWSTETDDLVMYSASSLIVPLADEMTVIYQLTKYYTTACRSKLKQPTYMSILLGTTVSRSARLSFMSPRMGNFFL